jgi:hypothetical protein
MFNTTKGNRKFHLKTVQLTLLMNTYILPTTTLPKIILNITDNAKVEEKP